MKASLIRLLVLLPCHYPDDSECPKDYLGHLVLLDIFTQFSKFQPGISTVVEDEDEGSDPDEVTGPGEGHQEDGDDVMDKVLEEIFSFNI